MLLHGASLPALSALNAQSSAQLANGRCSGILIWASLPSVIPKILVDVSMRIGDQGNEQLIGKMNLLPLTERNDIQGGNGYGAKWEKQNATAASETEDIPAMGIFISLGNLLLQGKDQLSVTLTVATAFTGTEELEWCFVDAPPGPESILKFSLVPSGQAIAEDPEEVYVFRTSGDAPDQQVSAVLAAALTINLKVGQSSYAPSGRMAWAFTQAIGEVEDGGTRRTVQVYGDRSQRRIGEAVNCTLSGSDAANYNVLLVERVKKADRSQVAQRAYFNEVAMKNSVLATRAPERFAAYRAERG